MTNADWWGTVRSRRDREAPLETSLLWSAPQGRPGGARGAPHHRGRRRRVAVPVEWRAPREPAVQDRRGLATARRVGGEAEGPSRRRGGCERCGTRARRPTFSGRAMTIAAPGWTFEAQLEEDEFSMLWLNTRNLVTGKRQGPYLLSAVLKTATAQHPHDPMGSLRPGRSGGGSVTEPAHNRDHRTAAIARRRRDRGCVAPSVDRKRPGGSTHARGGLVLAAEPEDRPKDRIDSGR